MRFNKSREDNEICFEKLTVDHNRALKTGGFNLDKLGLIVGIVLQTAVIGNDVFTQHFDQFLPGLEAMGPQAVQEGNVLTFDPMCNDFLKDHRQKAIVRGRPGDITVNDEHPQPWFEEFIDWVVVYRVVKGFLDRQGFVLECRPIPYGVCVCSLGCVDQQAIMAIINFCFNDWFILFV